MLRFGDVECDFEINTNLEAKISDIFTEDLKNICLKQLVQNLLSNKDNNNRIIKFFLDWFDGNGGENNIVFSETTSFDILYGAYKSDTIKLNSYTLPAASAEYVTSVIAQEMIHAIMSMGTQGAYSIGQLYQHISIFKSWSEDIASLLVDIYSIPLRDAAALSIGGISDVFKDEGISSNSEIFATL